MENRSDILYHLKEHSVPPPAEVADRVRAIPDRETAVLERLRDHSVSPPPGLRTLINSKIARPADRRFRLFVRYGAVACGILLVAGILFYRRFGPSQVDSTKNVAKVPAIPVQVDRLHAGGKDSAETSGPGSAADTASSVSPRALELTLNGEEYLLTDNNVLATFTSFHYPKLKAYVIDREEKTDLSIHLDAYTNIRLSEAMIANLKELYQTRPDGSPSRGAKKVRERLQKWMQQDKKQFDPYHVLNPLDPVDLGQFLFPPLFSFNRRTSATIFPDASQAPSTAGPDSSQNSSASSMTVAYSLGLITTRKDNGVGETYNGGIQTLFDGGSAARLRLASLMRIQSIFMSGDTRHYTIFEESGKPQKKIILTAGQWLRYNGKYSGAAYDLGADTVSILGYACKKALITLKNGDRLTAWYTPRIHTSAQQLLEPAFAGVPGLVLRYEYTCRRKTIRYNAISLSRKPIDPVVLAIPSRP